jgi:hypothetical protein
LAVDAAEVVKRGQVLGGSEGGKEKKERRQEAAPKSHVKRGEDSGRGDRRRKTEDRRRNAGKQEYGFRHEKYRNRPVRLGKPI